MREYCTYFDRHYLTRGLALVESLRRWSESPFRVWVLCFDRDTYDLLAALALPEVTLIRADDFEQANPDLARLKPDRARLAYYWSCTPILLQYVFDQSPDIDTVTYLDADLLFFSSPEPVYQEMNRASILLIPHRLATHRDLESIVGAFNVQMMVFRRDPEGSAALDWWRARCIEWCSSQPQEAKFGDQKYLDDWPGRFRNVHVLRHKGAGVAPWNVGQYVLRTEDSRVSVDGEPLVFFHYHGFALLSDCIAIPNAHGYRIQRECRPLVYRPYLAGLRDATRRVRAVDQDFDGGYSRVTSRHLLRAVEQRNLLVETRGLAAASAWRRLGTQIDWPRPLDLAREGPGLAARWLRRRWSRLP